MPTGIRELKLWQEAVALAGDVARAAKPWAREHRALADATTERATAVACAVAGGYASYSTAHQLDEYRAAERALGDLDTRLAVVRHAGLLSAQAHAQLTTRSTAVARLLGGYVSYVERQVASAQLAVQQNAHDATPPNAAPFGGAEQALPHARRDA